MPVSRPKAPEIRCPTLFFADPVVVAAVVVAVDGDDVADDVVFVVGVFEVVFVAVFVVAVADAVGVGFAGADVDAVVAGVLSDDDDDDVLVRRALDVPGCSWTTPFWTCTTWPLISGPLLTFGSACSACLSSDWTESLPDERGLGDWVWSSLVDCVWSPVDDAAKSNCWWSRSLVDDVDAVVVGLLGSVVDSETPLSW